MIKHLTALTLTLALATTAQAEEPTPAELCKGLSETASSFMDARQRGVAMSKLMEIAGDSSLMQAMVVDVYDVPRYTTDAHQTREVRDFENKVYLQCYRELSR